MALHIALIAHDKMKPALADWVAAHQAALRPHQLVATGTTGAVLMERCPSLNIERVNSGPLGGDQQIGARIAEGKVNAVVFFIDPLSPMPHDVDVKALTRLCVVYDVPLAMSTATANAFIAAGLFADRKA
jgi:methylglyoxal synthase